MDSRGTVQVQRSGCGCLFFWPHCMLAKQMGEHHENTLGLLVGCPLGWSGASCCAVWIWEQHWALKWFWERGAGLWPWECSEAAETNHAKLGADGCQQLDDTPAKPGTECEADAVKNGDKMRLLMPVWAKAGIWERKIKKPQRFVHSLAWERREEGEVGTDWQGLDLSNGEEIAVVNRRQRLEATETGSGKGQEREATRRAWLKLQLLGSQNEQCGSALLTLHVLGEPPAADVSKSQNKTPYLCAWWLCLSLPVCNIHSEPCHMEPVRMLSSTVLVWQCLTAPRFFPLPDVVPVPWDIETCQHLSLRHWSHFQQEDFL